MNYIRIYIVFAILFINLFSGIFFVNAYSPTSKEQVKLNKIYYILELEFSKSPDKVEQFTNLLLSTKKSNGLSEKQLFFIDKLYEFVSNTDFQKTPKVLFNDPLKMFRKGFVDKYGGTILGDKLIDPKCTDKYYYVDNLAKQLDFPTELIFAVWKMETNCNMNNPANGYGIFQMTSFYFKPGRINDDQLYQQIKKFVDVSRGKISYYNRKFKKNISISYDKYDLYDIQLYSALYVGNYLKVDPKKGLFGNGNLSTKFKSNKDGVVTNLIKVLNWYLKNN